MALKTYRARIDVTALPGTATGAAVVQIIRADTTRTGDGSPGRPVRRLIEFWTLDGQLILRVDPLATLKPRKRKRKPAGAGAEQPAQIERGVCPACGLAVELDPAGRIPHHFDNLGGPCRGTDAGEPVLLPNAGAGAVPGVRPVDFGRSAGR